MRENLKYPAIIKYIADDKSYFVEFPDLQGCLTEGSTKDEAIYNAKEALDVYLDGLIDLKQEFPIPSNLKGDDVYYIVGELGTSSTYDEYHRKSYKKNREKILSDKREKEQK